ncbi:hypothetical protein BGY98DRAFT_936837 [Russula aff. rugulosa BPL654]|nr:hypothetical protein BGY98DRAFT_936837 [Russula aff. rugulosa BPL654]
MVKWRLWILAQERAAGQGGAGVASSESELRDVRSPSGARNHHHARHTCLAHQQANTLSRSLWPPTLPLRCKAGGGGLLLLLGTSTGTTTSLNVISENLRRNSKNVAIDQLPGHGWSLSDCGDSFITADSAKERKKKHGSFKMKTFSRCPNPPYFPTIGSDGGAPRCCAESMGIIQYTQVSTPLYASIRTRVSVIRRVWYQSQTVPYNGISDLLLTVTRSPLSGLDALLPRVDARLVAVSRKPTEPASNPRPEGPWTGDETAGALARKQKAVL